MRLVVVVLCALCACFSKPDGAFALQDARGDGPPGCSAFGAWSTPAQILMLNGPAKDEAPALSPDGTKIVFASSRGPSGFDLYLADFDGTAASNVRALTSLNSPDPESYPAWNADGSQLYFLRDGSQVLVSDFLVASEPPFGPPRVATELEGLDPYRRPRFTADGLEVFDERDYMDVGNREIAHAVRPTPTTPWAAPTPIPELAAPAFTAGSLAISGDGRTLMFMTDRNGTGSSQVVETTRADSSAAFGPIMTVGGLGISILHLDLSRDGGMLLFSRYTGSDDDIYVSRRPCLSQR